MSKQTWLILGLYSLSGCDSPLPPTATKLEIEQSAARYKDFLDLPVTEALPVSGVATYNGHFGRFEGKKTGSYTAYGDMVLSVDFAAATVSGELSRINSVKPNGTPDQTLSGSLPVDGSLTETGFKASAEGELSGVGVLPIRFGLNARLELTGEFRDQKAIADTVTGTISGKITSKMGSYSRNFTHGHFYATSEEE